MGHLTLRRLEILLCSSCAGRINRGLLSSSLGAMAIRDCQKWRLLEALRLDWKVRVTSTPLKEGTVTSY